MTQSCSRLWALALAIAVACTACSVSIGPTADEGKIEVKPGEPAEERAAKAAAGGLLVVLDARQAGQAWAHAGSILKSRSSENEWAGLLRGIDSMTGKVTARSFQSIGFTPIIEAGVPEGRYCAVFYRTKFEKTSADEKLVMSFEDGEWKLVGYFLTNMKFGG